MLLSTLAVFVAAGAAHAAEPKFLGPGENGLLRMNASGEYVVTWLDVDKRHPVWYASGNIASPIAEPVDAGSGTESEGVIPAITSSGERIITWFTYTYTAHSSIDTPTALTFSTAQPAAAVTTLPGDSRINGTQYGSPVAVDPNGNAFRVWTTQSGGSTAVYGSTRQAGGDFLPALPIFSAEARPLIVGATARLDANGTPTVLWNRAPVHCDWRSLLATRCQSVRGFVQVATGDGQGGFTPPARIAGGRNCGVESFDEAPSGAAVLVTLCDGRNWQLRYTTRAPGGQFGPSQPLGRDINGFGEPAARIAPDGRVTVLWKEDRWFGRSDSTQTVRFLVAAGVAGGPLSKPRQLFRSYRSMGDRRGLTLRLGSDGRTYVGGITAENPQPFVATLTPDLKIGPRTTIARTRSASSLQFAVADGGLGLALWNGLAPDHRYGLQIARFSAPPPT